MTTMNIVTATLASRAVSANQLKLTELMLANSVCDDAEWDAYIDQIDSDRQSDYRDLEWADQAAELADWEDDIALAAWEAWLASPEAVSNRELMTAEEVAQAASRMVAADIAAAIAQWE